MIRRTATLAALVFLVSLTMVNPSSAQHSANLAQEVGRIGLVPLWSKSVATGVGGKVSGVTVHVSPTKSYRGSEVIDKYGRRVLFSERSVSRLQSRAGYDQRSRLTELKQAELAAQRLEPRVEEREIPEVTLYVRTSLGTVAALDAETGKEKWSTLAGTPGYPSYGVSATDQYVVTLSGSTLYLLDAETGQLLDSIPTRSVPSGTPTIDGELIYTPTRNGAIDVLSTEDLKRQEFTLGSSGRIENRLTLSPSSISWTADDGSLYVANAGGPGLMYRFASPDTIVAKPAYLNGTLFAVSADGFAIAIEEEGGHVKWRHSTGGSIREAPLAVDGSVYVTTTEGQMTALDQETGEVAWIANGIERFVSVSDSKIYCVSMSTDLTALDRDTGRRLGAAQVGDSSMSIVNTNTDRIYLVSKTGIVQCLRESGSRWPIVRMPETKPTEDAPTEDGESDESDDSASVEVPSAQEAPVVDEDPNDEMPFGDIGGEDDSEEEAQTVQEDEDDTDPFDFGDDGSDDTADPF